MRPAVFLSVFLAALSILGGCNSVHVTSNWDPNVDFGALTTWRFDQSSADHPAAGGINQDDFESSRVQYAIFARLRSSSLMKSNLS